MMILSGLSLGYKRSLEWGGRVSAQSLSAGIKSAAWALSSSLFAIGVLSSHAPVNATETANQIKVKSHVVKVKSHSKVTTKAKVTVEETPGEVYYTTRTEKVPNTRKFAPYSPHAVHTGTPPRPPRHHLLTGHVGEQTLQDETGSSVKQGSAAAESREKLPGSDLLSAAPALGHVETGSATGKTFRAWLGKRLTDEITHNGKPDAVLVMKGRWDHAEHVLAGCHIPCKIVDSKQLERMLWSAKILIINCPGAVSDNLARRIRSFVERGGYLLTTDWALDGCLESACPGYAYWDGANSAGGVFDAVAVEPQNELFSHAVTFAPWKLDEKSQIVKIAENKAVHVLVRSRLLSREDPSRAGILALTFQCGKGRVLHLVGHFDNNTNLAFQSALPDPAPAIGISMRQALALNFLMEALSHRKEVTDKAQ